MSLSQDAVLQQDPEIIELINQLREKTEIQALTPLYTPDERCPAGMRPCDNWTHDECPDDSALTRPPVYNINGDPCHLYPYVRGGGQCGVKGGQCGVSGGNTEIANLVKQIYDKIQQIETKVQTIYTTSTKCPVGMRVAERGEQPLYYDQNSNPKIFNVNGDQCYPDSTLVKTGVDEFNIMKRDTLRLISIALQKLRENPTNLTDEQKRLLGL